MLANRYIYSASTLQQQICNDKISFSTLNSSSDLIIASNPSSLNQLISESYNHLFIFEMSLEDFLGYGNAGFARVISNPYIEFPYRVMNLSSYPTISSIASGPAGDNLAIPGSSSSNPPLSYVINNNYGYLSVIEQIRASCLANNFKFNTPFNAHIFQTNYTFFQNFTYRTTAYDSFNIAMIDDSNKVLIINASWPVVLFQGASANTDYENT